jgi:WD40 repeat protein
VWWRVVCCFRCVRLPIIISGSEDGTVRIWHSTTYRAETTLNYGLERVWGLAANKDTNKWVETMFPQTRPRDTIEANAV